MALFIPIVAAAVAGSGFGAFIGSQVDDAVEVFTGEKGGIPWLPLIILAGVLFAVYMWTKKKGFS